MKRLLSIIFLTFLLTSAICSCRSSKQSKVEYADTTSVFASESVSKTSDAEILSLFSASRELDLTGITVEFFPPDTAHPDARAAPKSLTIETAKAKESTGQATKKTAAVDEQKTVNLSAQSAVSLRQDTQSYNYLLRPSDWVIFVSLLCAIIIAIIYLIIKFRHNGTLY